jgi:hypothetical protein
MMRYALERESARGSTPAVPVELSEGRDVGSGPMSRARDLASNCLPLDQFAALDFYVGGCMWRWLMKKHRKLHRKGTRLVRLPSLLRPTHKLWREGNVEQFLLTMLRVERFRRGWMRNPAYICVPGEPDA